MVSLPSKKFRGKIAESWIIIKIKTISNKIFLVIGWLHFLAFAIGLFLASYVAENKNTIHSEQNHTIKYKRERAVSKNRPDRGCDFLR